MFVLWLIATTGLLLYLAFTVHLCLLALGHPYQLDYGEGLVLYQARLLAHGQSIYKAADSYPYIFSNYPPLFQALVSPLIAVLGTSFLPGRLLGAASACGLGILLYWLVRRSTNSRPGAAIASLLFLGSPYIYHWAPLFRIDLPALFLSALGALVLWRATLRPSDMTIASGWRSALTTAIPPVYLSGLLFTLGLYTKQSYVAAPAAALVFLALSNRRAFWQLVLALVVLGLFPFLALEVATGGAFSFGLFTANVNPFSLSLLLSQLRDFGATFAVIIILAAIGALGGQQGASGREKGVAGISYLHWYLLAALATLLFAGKAGAWENYFFEALFMLCAFAGVGIAHLMRRKSSALRSLAPLALIIQLVLMWHDPRIGVQAVEESAVANRTLAPLIARQTGMILSEDLGLLLVNGQDIPYFSFEYAQLAGVGKWDQRWELDNLLAGRFALVVLEKGTREDPDKYQRFTRQVLSAVDAAYGLVTEVGAYRVYAPMPLLRHLDVSFGEQVALLGYRLDTPVVQTSEIVVPAPGAAIPVLNPYPSTLRLTLVWQARTRMATDYKIFAHLEDSAGVRRAQSDAQPFFGLYPTSRWADGEVVRDYLDIALPSSLPAGRYTVRVGLYDPATGQRLARPDGSTSVPLASLPIGLETHAWQPSAPVRAAFANGITLVASDPLPTQAATGSSVTLTTRWRASKYVDTDYAVFVHLAQGGQPLAQADGQPLNGDYPTSIWNPGEDITDTRVLTIPPDLPAGTYFLLVGLYDQATQTRVALAGGGDSVVLAEINIVR